jgi:hypothetical protein
MRMVSSRRWAFAAALLFAAAPAFAAPAAADKEKLAEKPKSPLDAVVTVKIEHQPLNAALEILKEKSGVNLVLDVLTIQQQLGVTPEMMPPVDLDVKDVKFKTALRTLLRPYNLFYAVVDDTLVVTTEEAAAAKQLQQRVSVDFDKVEFAKAVKQMGRDSGVNLIIDSRVTKEAKASVSLELEDVPLETALRLLSEMAGLKPVRIGNVLFVTKKETANELRNDPDLGGLSNTMQQDRQQELMRQQIMIQQQMGGMVIQRQMIIGGQAGATAPTQPAVPNDPVTIKQSGDKPADDKPKSDDAPPKKDGDK